jgi:hypothetical protein
MGGTVTGGHEWQRGPSNPVRPRDASALSGVKMSKVKKAVENMKNEVSL